MLCFQYCILYVIVQCSKLEAVGKPVLIIIIIIKLEEYNNSAAINQKLKTAPFGPIRGPEWSDIIEITFLYDFQSKSTNIRQIMRKTGF